MTPEAAPRTRARPARLIGTLVTLALLFYLLARHWGEIANALARLGAEILVLGLVLIGLSRVAVAARWAVLLRGAAAPLRPGQALRLTFAGLFASNFLPTTVGGDVVRLAGGMALGVESAVCTASLVADRVVGATGMLVALPFGLQALWSATGSPLVAWGAAAVSPEDGWWRRAWRKALGFGRRLLAAMAGWLRRPRALAAALAFTWLHMGLLFATLWLLLRAMDEPVSFLRVGGLWSLVYYVSLLPFSLNGLGIQELSLTVVMTRLGGISLEAALALAVLVRVLYMLASLPGAIFLPGVLPGRGGSPPSAGARGARSG